MPLRPYCTWILAAAALLPLSASGAAFPRVPGSIIASPEPGWPQWRGPRRDGVSLETGLRQEWPAGGPPRIWKVGGLGAGYASPILSEGRIYIAGDAGDSLRLTALDLDGRLVWRATNGASWKGPYPGARACCAYSAGRVFQRNAHGQVGCFAADTGAALWQVDTLERFGARNVEWALGECLLVDGTNVYVTAGGRGAAVAALSVKDGSTAWTSLLPAGAGGGGEDRPGYGSPLLVNLEGRRVLLGATWRNVYAADVERRRVVWSAPMATRYSVVPMTPTWCGDGWFITAPDTEEGGRFYALPVGVATADRMPFSLVWTTRLDTCHGGVVYAGGELLGTYYRAGKGWVSLDARDGRVHHTRDEFAKGSLVHADGCIYGVAENGLVLLLRSLPSELKVLSTFQWVRSKDHDAWAHPVILDGRLYLRYHDDLYCYDIRAGAPAASQQDGN